MGRGKEKSLKIKPRLINPRKMTLWHFLTRFLCAPQSPLTTFVVPIQNKNIKKKEIEQILFDTSLLTYKFCVTRIATTTTN